MWGGGGGDGGPPSISSSIVTISAVSARREETRTEFGWIGRGSTEEEDEDGADGEGSVVLPFVAGSSSASFVIGLGSMAVARLAWLLGGSSVSSCVGSDICGTGLSAIGLTLRSC